MVSLSVAYLGAMSDLRSLCSWIDECGTDYDVAASGDVVINQVCWLLCQEMLL